ncbi:MAG: hypothetical protein ACYC35_09695 [Pirellulales bacterium]
MKSAVVALCLVLLCCSSACAWPYAVGVGVYAPAPYMSYYGGYYPPSVYYPPTPVMVPSPVVVAPPMIVPRVVVPAPVLIGPRVYYARPVRPFVRAVIW